MDEDLEEEFEDQSLSAQFQMYTALCGNVLDGFVVVGLWTDPKEAEAWLDKVGEEEYNIVSILDQNTINEEFMKNREEHD